MELAVNQSLEVVWHRMEFQLEDIVEAISALKEKRRFEFLAEKFDQICQIQKIRDAQLQIQPLRLVEALHRSCYAEASDPHDKVYSVMGLSYDGSVFIPFPTYTQTVKVLSRDITKRWIRATKSLDIIFFRGDRGEWFPNWFDGKLWKDRRLARCFTGCILPGANYHWPDDGNARSDQSWSTSACRPAVVMFVTDGNNC